MHAKSREEAEKLYEEKEEVHVRDGVREFGEERRKWGVEGRAGNSCRSLA